MPRPVTAFRVRLSAFGGVSIKTAIAQEVIYEWNATRSWDEKKVLVPVVGEDPGVSRDDIDCLIAFFCASQGAPDVADSRELDAEIEHQAKSGRPTLVCFSEGRTDFDAVGADELRDLTEFKKRYSCEVMIESFKDEKELRAKLAQKIEGIVCYHAHFRLENEVAPTGEALAVPAVDLSDEARGLLISACDDPEAYLARVQVGGSLKIQVNGKQYVTPDSAAKWQAAFDELIRENMIRDVGCNGQLFQISGPGFKFLESIGKTPVGYIAELGGM